MNSRCNRFVFVAGLHRTGTSLLARIIGSHPEISMIEGSGVPENEGCYLQGAIPHTALHGRPGHFATDSPGHLDDLIDSTLDRQTVFEELGKTWQTKPKNYRSR